MGLYKFKSVKCLKIIFFIQVFQLNVLVYNGYLVFIRLGPWVVFRLLLNLWQVSGGEGWR